MRTLKLLSITTLALVIIATGCGQKQDEKQADETTAPETREIFHVFSFDGVMGNRYMMHFNADNSEATLFTRDETLSLLPQPAAFGAKYKGERIMVWIKDDEVMLEVDNKKVGPCKVSGLQHILSKAWLSGGDFWAVGNEPSWNLVMGADRVILLTEMGKTSVVFDGLEKGVFDPRNPYGSYSFTNKENHELVVEVLEGRCTNMMSGEPFALSVKLLLDGKEMSGCGTGLF